jgi:hypothetical protein
LYVKNVSAGNISSTARVRSNRKNFAQRRIVQRVLVEKYRWDEEIELKSAAEVWIECMENEVPTLYDFVREFLLDPASTESACT